MPNVRAIVVVPSSARAAANLAARNWDDSQTAEEQAASGQTFEGAMLSASGNLPATHYACSTVLPARKILRAQDRLAQLPAAVRWVVLLGALPTGRVAATNVPGVSPGQTFDYESLLSAMGLLAIASGP